MTAQTVSPKLPLRTPQVRDRSSTMPRPRPPTADSDAFVWRGLVGLPPSLTVTSTDSLATFQVTWIREPGSDCA